jgi:group I intron endonuclease
MYIYEIKSKANGKFYIGQHAGSDLEAYLRHNILAATRGDKGKTLLYRAIRKHGSEQFEIRPLVYCNSKEEMDNLEKIWIIEYNSRDPNFGYNVAEGGTGGNTREGTFKSEEEIEKLKKSLIGKPKSEEHRKNLSASRIGMKCPWIVESNKRRASLNPSKSAIRNRRYRENKKLRGFNGINSQ